MSGNNDNTAGGVRGLTRGHMQSLSVSRCLGNHIFGGSDMQARCPRSQVPTVAKLCSVLILVLLLAFSIGTAYSQEEGNALDFDGIDDSVVISKTLDPPDQGTAEFWINADASDSRRGMGGHDAFEFRLDPAPAGNGYVLDHQFFIGGSDTLHATTALPFGEWHHIACTWDSDGTAQIYIDGVLDATGNQAANDPGPLSFTIGTRTGMSGGSDYFDGRLDEVRIWSEVRTEEQIQEHMFKTIANPENQATLIAYWRFDEKSGTDCIDHSGSEFDGKMTKMDPATARIASTAPVNAAVLPASKLSTTWGSIRKR